MHGLNGRAHTFDMLKHVPHTRLPPKPFVLTTDASCVNNTIYYLMGDVLVEWMNHSIHFMVW